MSVDKKIKDLECKIKKLQDELNFLNVITKSFAKVTVTNEGYICCKELNNCVDKVELYNHYSCYCAAPYLEVSGYKIYSDPDKIVIGYLDVIYKDWETRMRHEGISEVVINQVREIVADEPILPLTECLVR